MSINVNTAFSKVNAARPADTLNSYLAKLVGENPNARIEWEWKIETPGLDPRTCSLEDLVGLTEVPAQIAAVVVDGGVSVPEADLPFFAALAFVREVDAERMSFVHLKDNTAFPVQAFTSGDIVEPEESLDDSRYDHQDAVDHFDMDVSTQRQNILRRSAQIALVKLVNSSFAACSLIERIRYERTAQEIQAEADRQERRTRALMWLETNQLPYTTSTGKAVVAPEVISGLTGDAFLDATLFLCGSGVSFVKDPQVAWASAPAVLEGDGTQIPFDIVGVKYNSKAWKEMRSSLSRLIDDSVTWLNEPVSRNEHDERFRTVSANVLLDHLMSTEKDMSEATFGMAVLRWLHANWELTTPQTAAGLLTRLEKMHVIDLIRCSTIEKQKFFLEAYKLSRKS